MATLALLSRSTDPSSYGLVRRREGGEVLGFLEKPDPAEIDTDEVNAGAYVIEPSVIDLIPAGRAGVDRARDLPAAGRATGLYGLRLDGYWMDIGTPERYLQASWDILEGTVETELEGIGGPWIAAGARGLGRRHASRARAVVRSGSRIGDGAVVSEQRPARRLPVGADAEVDGSILAQRVEVGDGATIGAGSVIGERRPGRGRRRGRPRAPGSRPAR